MVVLLSDQIIFTDKIARMYWLDNSLWVVIPGEPDLELKGEDAQTLWQTFCEPGWKESD